MAKEYNTPVFISASEKYILRKRRRSRRIKGYGQKFLGRNKYKAGVESVVAGKNFHNMIDQSKHN